MKKILLGIVLTIFLCSCSVSKVNGMTFTQEHMNYIIEYCEYFEVDFDLALAILLVENPELNKDAIRHNRNGSTDYGFYQINSSISDEVLDKIKRVKNIKKNDIMDARTNICAAIYILYRNGVQLEQWGIEINKFNLAVMYHRPADMKKIINGEMDTIGEAYAIKVIEKVNELNEQNKYLE